MNLLLVKPSKALGKIDRVHELVKSTGNGSIELELDKKLSKIEQVNNSRQVCQSRQTCCASQLCMLGKTRACGLVESNICHD